MHKRFALFLALLINLSLFSQSKKIDSLLGAIQKTDDNIEKLSIYKSVFKLINQQSKTVEQNEIYLQKIYELAIIVKSEEDQAYALYELGWHHYYTKSFGPCFKNWKQAKTLYRNLKDSLKVAKICSGAGESYRFVGSYENSMKQLFEGLNISERIKNHELTTQILSKIGATYFELNDNEKSITSYQKAIALGEKEDLKREIAFASQNLGDVYRKNQAHNKAIKSYLKALEIYNQLDIKTGIARCHQVLSIAHMDKKEWGKAGSLLATSTEIYNRLNNETAINKNQLILGELLFNTKNYTESKAKATRSLEIAKKAKNYNHEIEALYLIFKSEKALGNIEEALETHIKFINRKDEIDRAIARNYAENTRLGYTLEKNKYVAERDRIALANLDATADRLENNTRILVIISIVSLLFLIAFLFLLKQGKTIRKNNTDLSQQNQLIENQNKEITDIANELGKSNKEISRINENLENMINERTRDLEEKNKLLLKYSQMNSHDVRAPLARILGLVDLLKESVRTKDQQILIECLLQSASEMDEVVKTMNNVLHQSTKTIK